MRQLLIKLGLWKLSHEEYFKYLSRYHDDLANTIIEKFSSENNLIKEDRNKSICEIKTFFWLYGQHTLQENLSNDLFDRTMKHFRINIVFSSINEHDYTDSYIQSFFRERSEFYRNGFSSLSEGEKIPSINSFYKQIETLWFEKPFAAIKEIQEPSIINFDIFNQLKGTAKISSLLSNLMPTYTESLKDFIKMTNK